MTARHAAALAALLLLLGMALVEWGDSNGGPASIQAPDTSNGKVLGPSFDDDELVADRGLAGTTDSGPIDTERVEVRPSETEPEREERRGWSQRIGTAGRVTGTLEFPVVGRVDWDSFVLEGSEGRPEHIGARRAGRLLRKAREGGEDQERFDFDLEALPPGHYVLAAEATVRPDGQDVVHLVRWTRSFAVDDGRTTALGVVRDTHSVIDLEMVLRDLQGNRVLIEEESERPAWSLLLQGKSEPVSDQRRLTMDTFGEPSLGSDGLVELSRFVTARRNRFSISWPDGLTTIALVQREYEEFGGWRLLDRDQYVQLSDLVEAGGVLEWTVCRTAPLELQLVVPAGVDAPVHADVTFTCTASGTRIWRAGWIDPLGAVGAGTLHRLLVEDAPVGEFDLLGRAEFHWDRAMRGFDVRPWPTGAGALFEGRVLVEPGGNSVQRLVVTLGATLRGDLSSDEPWFPSSVSVRPEVGERSSAWFSAEVARRANARRASWTASGLLPNTRYLVGDGGRVVTTGGEGSTRVVELDASDFPDAASDAESDE